MSHFILKGPRHLYAINMHIRTLFISSLDPSVRAVANTFRSDVYSFSKLLNVSFLGNQSKRFSFQTVAFSMSNPSSSECKNSESGLHLNDEIVNVEEEDEDLETSEYQELVNRTFKVREMGHQVFVIQPYIKWGPSKKESTTPDFQLSESVALIETLQNWKVVDKEKVPLLSTRKSKLFGSGKLELLTEIVRQNKLITAVFVSVDTLTRGQHEFLEDEFKVPVYDRYNIVIQIFREHAVTREAKLQVAMAEIPYLWRNLRTVNDRSSGDASSVGGSGETLYEVRKRVLSEQERKVKRALKKLREHRELLRTRRRKRQFPTVAVVGYTNAGKTSLIKALTQKEEMRPKDELFATLDVTCHSSLLPSNIRVLYVDTIGFISDIPTSLIEPFVATLEDAILADVVVHVVDVSNPDHVAQTKLVIATLEQLKLGRNLLDSVISVANKVDLLTEDELATIEEHMVPVSSVRSTGLIELRDRIEGTLLRNTDRTKIRIRVDNGGPEFSWLYKESSVTRVRADEKDGQFVFMDVVITKANLERFKYTFITSKKHQRLKAK